ncbi:TorD/DmsD family molecular chaperone [Desulfoluna spongiiphila]|uniref:Chaperone TorD involved in molybdoenzyme TorA maturation n=1 Tax=Desulfoluna spongiiphila TaxID=419481 RepID=A0A1G5ESX5_9BACT|nr:molecular chaperone TorD family protein [Desulfoluna spongiiphila]SCY29528.1 chaperone TorD involved in molybdoenzyme TorA maturation [Desulfoluna spongiiphila]
MNTDDIIRFESVRQGVYQGLSACFCLPGPRLAPVPDTLVCLLTAQESEAVGPMARMASAIESPTDFSKLRTEFTRLFVGPYGRLAPPCGSGYMDGADTMMSASAMDAEARYRKAGLVVADTFKEAPDHIVAELEFLCFLVEKEIDALGPDTDEVPQARLREQKEFLERHLARWVPPFTENITRHATSPFYLNLATATRIIIRESMDYLSIPGLSEQPTPTRSRPSTATPPRSRGARTIFLKNEKTKAMPPAAR